MVLSDEEHIGAHQTGRSQLASAMAIETCAACHNGRPKPFIWVRSARDILQKVIRANSRSSSKQNEALH